MNDPELIDQIYTRAPGSRCEKYKTILRISRAPGSIIATKDHDLRRRRRVVLNPDFSMQNVRRLEPVIQQILLNLFSRMDAWACVGTPAPMHIAYKATTKDIIHSYAFGEGEKCLEMGDLNAGFFHSPEPVWTNNIGTNLPLFIEIMSNLPPLVVSQVFHGLLTLSDL
jgi:cytochrome P450